MINLKGMFGWGETGRMENKEGKIGWKMAFSTIWLKGRGGEKSGGAHQNTISPNWSEKWQKYLDKTAPTSFLRFWLLLFFLISFDFSFVTLASCFCFCFFFLSLVFSGGGFFFFSFFFFFFLNFFLLFF